MSTQRLQMLFCERFHCPAAEYEHRMFRKSLYWHARLLAPLLRSLKADFFALDLQFIRYLGESTGPREVVVDLLNFRDANLGRGNFWRTALKLRVSGRKAGRLAQELFAETPRQIRACWRDRQPRAAKTPRGRNCARPKKLETLY